MFIQMQTMDESHIEAQQMSQDEDHESESVRSDATTEENDDEGNSIHSSMILLTA